MQILYLIANFGGPRHLQEVGIFLNALLTDPDVIRTPLPKWLHRWNFSRVAAKRAKVVVKDYEKIGGKSPIYEDTENIALGLRDLLQGDVLAFHRYLPGTHQSFKDVIHFSSCDEIHVFPMFPQFSYVTTGSVARWFEDNLEERVLNKMRWVASYAGHPAYIRCFQRLIQEFLAEQGLKEEETFFLFSPHGLPKKYVEDGDIYETECQLSYGRILSAFPNVKSVLAYQSKFGKGEWLRPYTNELCEEVLSWHEGRKNIVFIPLSFTSDHIETLFEIEELYLPLIQAKGLRAFRCPALNLRRDWIEAIAQILKGGELRVRNDRLILGNCDLKHAIFRS